MFGVEAANDQRPNDRRLILEDLSAEQPVPEKDPIVTKSYAAYYVIAMMILMVTLFWALWDESFGQRPWKAFQHAVEGPLHRLPEHRAVKVVASRKRMLSRIRSTSNWNRPTRTPTRPPSPAGTNCKNRSPI